MTEKTTFQLEGKAVQIALKIKEVTGTRKKLLTELKERGRKEFEAINEHAQQSHDAAWDELGEELGMNLRDETAYRLDLAYYEDHGLAFMFKEEECDCKPDPQQMMAQLMQQGGGQIIKM